MPRSNGSTGSTTAACWSRSATCRRPKPKRPTTGSSRTPPQSPPDSNETASEEVGTVQAFDQAWGEIASHFNGDPSVTDAARIALANAILSVASDESRDVEVLKQAGLQVMARNNKLP